MRVRWGQTYLFRQTLSETDWQVITTGKEIVNKAFLSCSKQLRQVKTYAGNTVFEINLTLGQRNYIMDLENFSAFREDEVLIAPSTGKHSNYMVFPYKISVYQ